MSTQTYEPLRVVPPLKDRDGMAWLLHLRRLARQARDAVLAAPRAAMAYVGRLAGSARLRSASGWLRWLAGQVSRPLSAAMDRLGAAGLTAGLTSPTGQQVIGKTSRLAGRVVGWLTRGLYSAIDRGLRLFGKPGNKVADRLFDAVVSAGGKVAAVAAPVVHRVARVTDPQSAHVRMLAGISRSYFLHRALKAVIGNSVVRFLVEGVLLPAALDSRAAQWLRRQLRVLKQRAASLSEQAQALPRLTGGNVPEAGGAPAASRPGRPVVDLPLPEWEALNDDDFPIPSNRAERRAQDRQLRRHPRST